jgi:hypothetical protein
MGLALLCLSFSVGCASKVLEHQPSDKLENNKEFESMVKIKEIPPKPEEVPAPAPPVPAAPTAKPAPAAPPPAAVKPAPVPVAKKEVKKSVAPKVTSTQVKKMKRQPELEDSEGFDGRRPLVDPFKLGESVILSLSYFNITAGTMELKVGPSAEVNGKKAHTFSVILKSNSMFSRFYSVDDNASTHVSYDTLLPFDHQISVKESKQVREIKSYFNFDKGIANFWETKVTKDKGEESKKLKWKIKPYSQNVVSAVFYLRNFQLTPGKKLAFRVAEDGKNILCNIEVLRKEKLKTDIGTFDTVVVQPKLEVDGVFKPMGDVLFWLTDDDRKFVVRIESKIKIGTIIAKVKSIKR